VIIRDGTANKKHSELFQKAMADIRARKLSADTLIADLAAKSNRIAFTDPIYMAAIKRLRLGNPPGKKKSTIGDEVNWESLLTGVPDVQDLHIVSGDGDYSSPFDGSDFNSFLREEWETKKNSHIHFYKSISDFFKLEFPKIKLATDVRISLLIEKLASSVSFATTHAVIGSLAKTADFSKIQAEELIDIAELNNQVGWIIGDADLKAFYSEILAKNGMAISEEKRKTLETLLAPEPALEAFFSAIPDDEVPF
jgi:hypothetical protein